ncbi:hypothetical protein GCM10028798_32860 [Humibacter antri]
MSSTSPMIVHTTVLVRARGFGGKGGDGERGYPLMQTVRPFRGRRGASDRTCDSSSCQAR